MAAYLLAISYLVKICCLPAGGHPCRRSRRSAARNLIAPAERAPRAPPGAPPGIARAGTQACEIFVQWSPLPQALCAVERWRGGALASTPFLLLPLSSGQRLRRHKGSETGLRRATASPHTKNLEFQGFDSLDSCFYGVEFLGPWGDFPEIKDSETLSLRILRVRTGRAGRRPARAPQSLPRASDLAAGRGG